MKCNNIILKINDYDSLIPAQGAAELSVIAVYVNNIIIYLYCNLISNMVHTRSWI